MQKAILEDLEITLKDIKKEAKVLEGKTVLISGGAGFLGSYINFVIYLLNKRVLQKKCKVISIDNYITGSRDNLLTGMNDTGFYFLDADITKPVSIDEKVDYIIHAAGLASPYYYKKYPLETIESAILGAKNILDIAKSNKVKGFLFFSSSEIYGDPDSKSVPTSETYAGHVSSIGPRSCYDESKRLAETMCMVYHEIYDVPIKIVRPFNIYGPGMKHNDYRVIPTFIYKGFRGEDLPVHGMGIQTRTFCYITDAITAIFKVLISGKKGEVYNIGNDKPEISMYELASIVSELIGNGIKPQRIDYPKSYPAGEPQRRCPDLSKIKAELGYIPRVSLKLGLSKTVKWCKENWK